MLCGKPAENSGKGAELVEGLTKLRTNFYPIETEDDLQLWRYQVTVYEKDPGDPSGRWRDISRGAKDDYTRARRRAKCFQVYHQVVSSNRDIFRSPFSAAYDRWHTLFMKEKIYMPDGKKEVMVTLVEPEEEGGRSLDYMMRIEPFIPMEPVSLTDFMSLATLNLNLRDYSSQQAIEIISSQIIFFKNEYLKLGARAFCLADPAKAKEVGPGRLLLEGQQKSVRLIEGPADAPTLALQADTKYAAVHKPQPVTKLLVQMANCTLEQINEKGFQGGAFERFYRPLSHAIRDVMVKVTYRRKGVYAFGVHDISSKPAYLLTFDFYDEAKKMERTLDVASYFQTRYGIDLKYSFLPCLVERRPPKEKGGEYRHFYYPMELCSVGESQRIPLHKQTQAQMQAMIKETAIAPTRHFEQLDEKLKDTQVLSNKFLKSLGLSVAQTPMVVEGKVLKRPNVKYTDAFNGKEKNVAVSRRGDWELGRGVRFLKAGKNAAWNCLCLDQRVDSGVLNKFGQMFVGKAEQLGVQLGKCSDPMMAEPAQLDYFFKEFAGQGITFVLLFMPGSKDQVLKDQVKALELRYQILTQCVRTPIVLEIVNGRKASALENILNKTNMKLGGCNFAVVPPSPELTAKFFDGRTMFVGADVSHPPPPSAEDRRRNVEMREPSVVGFVASAAGNPHLYTGEHSYHKGRVEEILDMKALMVEMLTRYRKGSEEGAYPRAVIYFRDGVAEGQFKMVLDCEVENMRAACQELYPELGLPLPKITVVVVLKRHMTRLMGVDVSPRAPAKEQDYPVGTAVDKRIVHPKMFEFYLKSHLAIQGTATITKYCVLQDELECGQEEMEQLCYSLAMGHQIVTKAVSLPAPVYGAHEMAERGKRLWRASKQTEGSSRASTEDGAEPPNWETITAELRVGGTLFADRKHWA